MKKITKYINKPVIMLVDPMAQDFELFFKNGFITKKLCLQYLEKW